MGSWLRACALALGSGVLAVLVLEGVYRYQVIDLYRLELRSFNTAASLAREEAPTLLIMGDSFTAGRTSYAGLLQERLPTWRVVNTGVSGTGVLQALSMAPHRFARFRPRVFLYQIYVGNDLFDLRYPVNWQTITPARNLYWLLANHLRILGFVNYRLRHLTASAVTTAWADAPGFDAERYDARVRLYLQAEPTLLEDSIQVQGTRKHDYARLLAGLTPLLAHCQPAACRAAVLVIPHMVQVDPYALAMLRQLGAQFRLPEALERIDYPFVAGIRQHLTALPHVQVLNPLPMLRAQQREQPLYFTYDEHLNGAGQQALAAWVQERLGVP